MNQPIFQSKICFVVVKQAICASTNIETKSHWYPEEKNILRSHQALPPPIHKLKKNLVFLKLES